MNCYQTTFTQLTARDVRLFQKLNVAGWLTTAQIGAYFFPGKSLNASSKRLRKLVAAGYLADAQVSSTESKFYRLTGRGRRFLEEHNHAALLLTLPTQLPRKLHHFTAVNDLRLAFETALPHSSLTLEYFHSEREYLQVRRCPDHPLQAVLPLLTTYQLIPDALAGLRAGRQYLPLALEYDAGTEPAHYFGRRKMQQYLDCWASAPEAFTHCRLLVVVPTLKRLLSLMRQTALVNPPVGRFFFALLKKFKLATWVQEPSFLDPTEYFVVGWEGEQRIVQEKQFAREVLPRHALTGLLATSPGNLSLREEKVAAVNANEMSALPKKQGFHY